ncbi:MAG TPA: hypothetical protein VJA27_02700 [Patescibacteria group bacterium]|nr:hypothetical protein [Patescibacteria group bacterium]
MIAPARWASGFLIIIVGVVLVLLTGGIVVAGVIDKFDTPTVGSPATYACRDHPDMRGAVAGIARCYNPGGGELRCAAGYVCHVEGIHGSEKASHTVPPGGSISLAQNWDYQLTRAEQQPIQKEAN